MSRFRLLTFDVARTLLRIHGSAGHQYALAARKFNIDIRADDIDKIYRPEWRVMKLDHPRYGINEGMTARIWWEKFVERVFIKAGYEGCKLKLVDIADNLYESFSQGSNWELVPGTVNVLETLKDMGIRLGVISNFDERLEVTLSKQNILHYFDFVVTSVNAGNEKPEPQIFHMALKKGRVAPVDAVHVGDDWDADFQGAMKIGMYGILFDPLKNYANFKECKSGNGCRIEDLTEILTVIKRI